MREEMVRLRNALESTQVSAYSQAIAARLTELLPLLQANTIMGFAPIGNEVDLREWMREQLLRGKTILLPRVEAGGTLAAVEFTGWQHTRVSSFGIQEPTGEALAFSSIDAVIVPGLVFDARGYRLGYGKGYYDRFLQRLPSTTFICGVCYEFQVVDDILPHAGDVPVHWIVTEKSELMINPDFF